jgi:hypothetical protein
MTDHKVRQAREARKATRKEKKDQGCTRAFVDDALSALARNATKSVRMKPPRLRPESKRRVRRTGGPIC